MREVFDRKLKVGDLVIPSHDGKLSVDNYISRLGLLVGDNEIFVKKKNFGKEVYKVINSDSCLLFDIVNSDEVLSVKTDLESQYKNYIHNKLKLENKVDELGSGTLFYKDGIEDWSHAYVYIGRMDSDVSITTNSFYGNSMNTSKVEDMCFENEFLYIPYTVILSIMLDKVRTNNTDKMTNLSKIIDMDKVYKNILKKGIISYNYVHRKQPMKMGKVITKLNLINVESSFEIKNIYTCNGRISFSEY